MLTVILTFHRSEKKQYIKFMLKHIELLDFAQDFRMLKLYSYQPSCDSFNEKNPAIFKLKKNVCNNNECIRMMYRDLRLVYSGVD